MTVLIASDKFKDSLSAIEVCKHIEEGIRKFDPNISTVLHPLADGGEGSLDALSSIIPLQTISVDVVDPLNRPIKACYMTSETTAYIEMARASGLHLLNRRERNCLHTTSFGTGQLIADAIYKGFKKIYLFVGGSATNDGGIGMANALGYEFLDEKGNQLMPVGKHLEKIRVIDNKNVSIPIENLDIKVASDVTNWLYGTSGATYIYGAQKGASQSDLTRLENGMKHFAAVCESTFKKSIASIPGAGAAGGLAGGALVFLDATIVSGIETIFQITNFEEKLMSANLIISGEGKIDAQTLYGKVVSGVAILAKKHQKPLGCICGTLEASQKVLRQMGISYVKAVKTHDMSLQHAMSQTSKRVVQLAYELMTDHQKN